MSQNEPSAKNLLVSESHPSYGFGINRQNSQGQVPQNGKVLVHCYAGVSRSAAVVLAYLMVHERMHLHLAIKLLREKHAISRPNQGFMNQLLRFYYRIKQKNGDNFFRGESRFSDEDWRLVFGIVDPNLGGHFDNG